MTWDYELYIDGQPAPSDGDGRITVLDPATEEVIGSVPDSTGTDMQRAIAAARRAFDEGPWPRGYFYEPTVLMDARNDMRIAQEEIFGPVLAVIAYDGTDAEAVRLANDSIYGLAGGVVSSDTSRAFNVARRIRTGMISVQTEVHGSVVPAAGDPQGPGWGAHPGPIGSSGAFGGFKQSGIGREWGGHGLAEFTELKAISWS